ncbi:claudin-8-like isoform X1 [Carassius auratus]|uniref:Claudin-8-like isoform X1 n=1 Tax=Carassius auratus TaxID=7957 RepID=A0A6P6LGM7_CARAU|nr:claudin-8-like isoform X1 [Carassius auratus]
MANGALEIVGMCVSLIGFVGVAASTGMPMWRVTAFIGENIIVMETRFEGLWMNCYRQASIRMQCKVYDSLLALSPDLQAARGLMCCSVALTGLGLLIAIAGMQCTACIQGNDRAKRMVLIISGCMILAGCFCCLIPVSWTGHVIIQDFYNPLLIDAQRRELWEALYIGWVSSAFLFAGGCIFTCCSGSLDEGPDPRYKYTRNAPMAYQPQPVTYHPQPHLVYSHPSGPPSFIEQSYQPSRHQSFIHPSRQQSFIDPSRQQSFIDPSRQQSFIDPSRQQSFIDPSRQQSFIHPSRQQSFIHPSRQQSFIHPSRQQSFIHPSRQQSFVQPSRYPSTRSAVDYI